VSATPPGEGRLPDARRAELGGSAWNEVAAYYQGRPVEIKWWAAGFLGASPLHLFRYTKNCSSIRRKDTSFGNVVLNSKVLPRTASH